MYGPGTMFPIRGELTLDFLLCSIHTENKFFYETLPWPGKYRGSEGVLGVWFKLQVFETSSDRWGRSYSRCPWRPLLIGEVVRTHVALGDRCPWRPLLIGEVVRTHVALGDPFWSARSSVLTLPLETPSDRWGCSYSRCPWRPLPLETPSDRRGRPYSRCPWRPLLIGEVVRTHVALGDPFWSVRSSVLTLPLETPSDRWGRSYSRCPWRPLLIGEVARTHVALGDPFWSARSFVLTLPLETPSDRWGRPYSRCPWRPLLIGEVVRTHVALGDVVGVVHDVSGQAEVADLHQLPLADQHVPGSQVPMNALRKGRRGN